MNRCECCGVKVDYTLYDVVSYKGEKLKVCEECRPEFQEDDYGYEDYILDVAEDMRKFNQCCKDMGD